MKKILFIALASIAALSSCDHVDNPYPFVEVQEIDTTLYPGLWDDYLNNEWPTFSANTNTQRNVLIEDFTGHQCIYCPLAADTAHALHHDYGDRMLIATIHSGPNGLDNFQSTSASYPIDWTNEDGLEIGQYLGQMPGSSFVGNPSGSLNRTVQGGGLNLSQAFWRPAAVALTNSTLKVNVQSDANFYASTSGLFLHVEVDVIDPSIVNDLYTVVYLIEDSLVGKQKMPDNTTNESYVHRDIMRDCIKSDWKGRQLTDDLLTDGKYLLDYSYVLPSIYNPDNVHLLVYVRDEVTDEIYQVIKQKLQ